MSDTLFEPPPPLAPLPHEPVYITVTVRAELDEKVDLVAYIREYPEDWERAGHDVEKLIDLVCERTEEEADFFSAITDVDCRPPEDTAERFARRLEPRYPKAWKE